MTQKEFEERVKNENLKMRYFSLEIGVLMKATDVLGIYNDNGVWKIYKTNDRDGHSYILDQANNENDAFDLLYEYVKSQINMESFSKY